MNAPKSLIFKLQNLLFIPAVFFLLVGCVSSNPTLIVETAPLQPINVAVNMKSATPEKLSRMCIIPFDPALPPKSDDATMPTNPRRKINIAMDVSRSGDQIAECIEREFLKNGVTVIDRKRLDYFVSEQKFSMSGLQNNPKEQRAVGEILGCSVMMFGQVGSFGGRYAYKSQGGKIIYTPSYSVGFTFRIVDVKSGEVLARGGGGASSRQLLKETFILSYSDVMSGHSKELPGIDRVIELAVSRGIAPIIDVINKK